MVSLDGIGLPRKFEATGVVDVCDVDKVNRLANMRTGSCFSP